jgi:CRP-like cAMP-binding protein
VASAQVTIGKNNSIRIFVFAMKMDPGSIRAILLNVGRSITLSEEEQAYFATLLIEKTYNKKQVLLSVGERCREQYYVVRGCLKISYLDEKGEEHIAKFAPEDWWAFDIESFFQETPGFYTISCLEDTTVLCLSQESHQKLMSHVPAFERFYRLMMQNSFIALQHRMTQSLALPAMERYERFQQKYPGLESRISQKNIAAYLGITPIFLSMLRKEVMDKH